MQRLSSPGGTYGVSDVFPPSQTPYGFSQDHIHCYGSGLFLEQCKLCTCAEVPVADFRVTNHGFVVIGKEEDHG